MCVPCSQLFPHASPSLLQVFDFIRWEPVLIRNRQVIPWAAETPDQAMVPQELPPKQPCRSFALVLWKKKIELCHTKQNIEKESITAVYYCYYCIVTMIVITSYKNILLLLFDQKYRTVNMRLNIITKASYYKSIIYFFVSVLFFDPSIMMDGSLFFSFFFLLFFDPFWYKG